MKQFFLYVLLAVFIVGCSSDDGNSGSDDATNSNNCGYFTAEGEFFCQIEDPSTLQNISDIPDNSIPFIFQIDESVTTSDDLITSYGIIGNIIETERTFIKVRAVSRSYLQDNLGDLSNLTDDDWEFTYYTISQDCFLGVPRTFNSTSFNINQFNLIQCQGAGRSDLEFIDLEDGVQVNHLCGLVSRGDAGQESFTFFKINL